MGLPDHDSLFKSTFGTLDLALSLVVACLPLALARRIDEPRTRFAPNEHIDSSLAQKRADIVLETRFRGVDTPVYLLIEHQSVFDRQMPIRLVEYSVQLWKRWRKESPGCSRFPIILTFLISHAPGGWRENPSLTLEQETSSDLRRLLEPFAFHFESFHLDLTVTPDEVIRAFRMRAIGRLTLLALKHARGSKELGERIVEWSSLAEETARAPRGGDALRELVEYLWNVGDVPRETIPGIVARLRRAHETRRIFMSTAKQLIEQGIEQGIERGVAQGERGLLLRQLTARFGPLPPAIRERVESASPTDIDRWGISLLVARSLEELFDS